MATKTPIPKLDTDKNPLAFTILLEENAEGRDFIPEPPLLKEKISNWPNQVLIPFSLSGKLLKLLSPYPTVKSHSGKVKNFFLGYPITMPSVLEERILDISFMDKPAHVFRSTPLTQSKKYITWLEKVQSQRKKQWQELGIYNMIKISRSWPRYNPAMLLASMFFWDGSNNTFQFPCGMLTPCFFDVAAITSVSPLGDIFTLTLETTNEFTIKRFSFNNFIIDNHENKNVEVSDQEHISFLTLWLSYYVFYFGSLQVAK